MDRTAVFVDAGYLLAQAGVLLYGSRQPRDRIVLDPQACAAALTDAARKATGLPLLRIYWYDGALDGRPTAEHQALGDCAGIRLRLGDVNGMGEQKGVDSLLLMDLGDLARNRAIADALVVCGDGDVRVGVHAAQAYGVRVHLLGVSPLRGSVSRLLLRDADTVMEWTAQDVAAFVSVESPSEREDRRTQLSRMAGEEGLVAFDARIDPLISRNRDEILRILADAEGSFARLPIEIDREVLDAGSLALGRHHLQPDERVVVRNAFVERAAAMLVESRPDA